MKLKKGKEEIHICDYCLKIKMVKSFIFKPEEEPRINLEVCNDCINKIHHKEGKSIIENFDSIKRLKWYEVLYQYLDEGYELL